MIKLHSYASPTVTHFPGRSLNLINATKCSEYGGRNEHNANQWKWGVQISVKKKSTTISALHNSLMDPRETNDR